MYYGTPVGDAAGEKAICASWEESYCFGSPRIMRVDSKSSSAEQDKIFVHHQNAKYKIQNNKVKLRECRDMSDALSRCLRRTGL
jgi:hypothetical protein